MVFTANMSPEWSRAAETAPSSDFAEISQTDLSLVKEELEFLQEETVSIAVAHEQPISEAPSNVYVITEEDIRHSGAPDLPTILRRIPGIEVSQMNGSEFNVSARGDNQQDANKMLVLVDGRSVYFDLQGGYFWKGIPVTLPEIKRIEVLKGPASSLYGFNAFDGVINIITKSPEETENIAAQIGGGEFDTISSALIHGGKLGPVAYKLSAGHDQTNQWGDRDTLSFRSNKFSFTGEYPLAKGSKIQLKGGFMDANRNEGPFIEVATPKTEYNDGYAQLGFQSQDSFIRGWYRRLTFDSDVAINPLLASFGPGGTSGIFVSSPGGDRTRDTTAESYDVEAQHALEFPSTGRLTFGVNFRHNTMNDNFIDDFSTENRLGVYVQNEKTFLERLTLVSGIRLDLHSEINPTYSPRLALIYRPHTDHTIRISGSLAYRPPTLNQTNSDLQSTTVLFGVPCNPLVPPPCPFPIKGNENLDPEQIISYEVGYQGWFLQHRLRVRTDAFYNHISDLIRSAGGSFTNDRGSADIFGGEASVEVLIQSWLSGFANYSFQEVGQSFSADARRSGPRFKYNMGLRGEWENGINGEIVYHHYGATTYPVNGTFSDFSVFGVAPPNSRIPSYNLLNIRGAYRFWKDRAELAISVFNALNDRHKEHPLGDVIKSRTLGWLTLRY